MLKNVFLPILLFCALTHRVAVCFKIFGIVRYEDKKEILKRLFK